MKGRDGYTLIELLVAMASASVLMVGMSTAIFVAGRAMGVDEGAVARRNESGGVLARVLAEIEEARRFISLDATTVEFTVPDRSGDGVEETIRYAWSGTAGDPLTRSFNGGAADVLFRQVESLNFRALTQPVTATGVADAPNPNSPVLRRWDWERPNGTARSIALPTPVGVVAGELLIAALALDGEHAASLVVPAGWNLLDSSSEGRAVTLAVAWKTATAVEPATATWSWPRNERVMGWTMRFSNQGLSPPTIAVGGGDRTSTATCPSANVGGNDALVLRIGAFDDDDITIGDLGMPGPVPVLMHTSANGGVGAVSAGCAYTIQSVAGVAPEASFTLNAEEQSRTCTVVILP